MNNQKGFAPIFLIILIPIITIVFFVGFFFIKGFIQGLFVNSTSEPINLEISQSRDAPANVVFTEDGYYINSKYGFEFEIPVDWRENLVISQLSLPKTDEKGNEILFSIQKEKYYFSLAMLPEKPGKEGVSEIMFSEKGRVLYSKYYDSIKATLHDSRLTEIDGKKALYFQYTTEEGLEEIEYKISNKDKEYILSIIAKASGTEFDSLELKVDQVIKSLKFNDK